MDRKGMNTDRILSNSKAQTALKQPRTVFCSVGLLTAMAVLSAHAAYSEESSTAPSKAVHAEVAKKVQAKTDSEQVERVSSEESPGFFRSLFGTYVAAFHSVQDKVDELRHLDEENRKLRLENAHLRATVESRNFECNAEQAQTRTQQYEGKLGAETESKTGRTLASIVYQIPKNLPPKELYSLGISYFRSRDDEKAAVILSSLVGMEDDERYRTPFNLMMTGVAWYRVEHFAKAELYFDQVIKASDNSGQPEFAGLKREALLWKGLIAERTGQHDKSQFWLKSVLDSSPGSVEAAMVNQLHAKSPRAQDAPHDTNKE
jgi:hypothetical protein